eukprot:SM000247S08280  [mRNA]  locus=s247:183967:186607:+ [translate_table: standard]
MSTLAAARADNFYYPPEWTPDKGGLNKFQGQHPLRERAKKIGEGILVIRFETPFNIWCGGCRSMIAKGVRFNAEKKQVGNYYSTKIWSFKMRAPCCGQEIEIRTNPQKCEYEVTSGAERKQEDFDPDDAETMVLPDTQEKEKLSDPLYRLEHGGEDKRRAKEAEPLLTRLQKVTDVRHADPYSLNKELRAQLRAQKRRVVEEEADARRRGLGIRLLPESPDDLQAASHAKFRTKFERNLRNKRAMIRASSIFSPTTPSSSRSKEDASTPSIPPSQTPAPLSERKRSADGAGKQLALLAKKRQVDAAGAMYLLSGQLNPSSKSKAPSLGIRKRRVAFRPVLAT